MVATPSVHAAPRSATGQVGRRFVLPGALAAAAVSGSAAAADDDDLSDYRPARFKGTDTLLSRQDRHLVSRFSYGVTPDLARDVRRAHREAKTGDRDDCRQAPADLPQIVPDPLGPGAPDDPDQEEDANTSRRDGGDRTTRGGGHVE